MVRHRIVRRLKPPVDKKVVKEVLLVHAPGCGACARIVPSARKMFKGKRGYRLVDVAKNPEVIRQYRLTATPTLIVKGKRTVKCTGTSGSLQKDLDLCILKAC